MELDAQRGVSYFCASSTAINIAGPSYAVLNVKSRHRVACTVQDPTLVFYGYDLCSNSAKSDEERKGTEMEECLVRNIKSEALLRQGSEIISLHCTGYTGVIPGCQRIE